MRKLFYIPLFITLLTTPTLLHANDKESVPYSFNYNEPFSLDNALIATCVTASKISFEVKISGLGTKSNGIIC